MHQDLMIRCISNITAFYTDFIPSSEIQASTQTQTSKRSTGLMPPVSSSPGELHPEILSSLGLGEATPTLMSKD